MKKIFTILILLSFLSCDYLVSELDELKGARPKKTDTLQKRKRMKPGGKLTSLNKKYEFEFQKDSNLVLTDITTGRKYWESSTANTKAIFLIINVDGTLKLRSKAGTEWIAPGSENSKSDKLVIHNDGSLVLYKDKTIIWSVDGPAIDPNPEPGPETISELHFVGEANYYHKTKPGGARFIEIDGYPAGAEFGDVALLTVFSDKPLRTPTGYELLISKTVNSLMPSYINNAVPISNAIRLTQYYAVVINPYGGSCIVGEADSMIVYVSIIRGEVIEK